MSDAMSIAPISSSETWDSQAQDFSWLEDQYSERDFIQLADPAPKSASDLDFVGESWLLSLTPTSVNAISHLPSPADSSSSAPERVTMEASNSDDAVNAIRAPRNAPRKRPGRYKNAPAHILNRRREQCRVAQQKHRERKDNRLAQLEMELKSLKDEYQMILNAYMQLDKAYKTFAAEVSSKVPEGVEHVRGLPVEDVETEAMASALVHEELFYIDHRLSGPLKWLCPGF
ncbi:hypothetical protein GGI35DRAFT_489263 [Trichoderma velutinum]